MKIIISPAKKMNRERELLMPMGTPVFMEKAQRLAEYLKEMEFEELKELLCCSHDIAKLNYDRYKTMDLREGDTPALFAYEGIQYQYMAPKVFEESYFRYVQEHLRILSGLYGILRPFDGVVPYRLEMQAKLKTDFCGDLYDYWGAELCQELLREEDTLLNLASREYSKSIEKHLPQGVRYISCSFGERQGDRVIEKGVYVKMARGEMVRFMAERGAETPEEIQAFDRLGFAFCESLSEKNHYVFLLDQQRRPKSMKPGKRI